MKKIVSLLFIMLLVGGMFSCKRTEQTYVRVLVRDPQTLRGKSHVKVVLFKSKTVWKPVQGYLDYSTVAELYTDKNGIAEFGNFETYKDSKYAYYVSADIGWGAILDEEQGHGLRKGELNEVTLDWHGQSSLQINFTPPPPYGVGDSLRVAFYSEGRPNNATIFTNNNYATTNHPFKIEYGNYCYNIDKYKSGVYTNIRDTVFYDNDSTYVYNVNW